MFELVFCVGHENTFCVLGSAFTHNMPTLSERENVPIARQGLFSLTSQVQTWIRVLVRLVAMQVIFSMVLPRVWMNEKSKLDKKS